MPQPPKTARELEQERQMRELLADMSSIADRLQQKNLNNAVLLAEQAASGEGELVEHFAELGRRFGETLQTRPQPKPVPNLHVVRGDAK